MTSGAARALLRGACTLGLMAAVLAVGDAMTTVVATSATRASLERDYVHRAGSTAEQAYAVVGTGLAGAFLAGLVFAAVIAVLAVRALRAARGVRAGLLVCTLLALGGALSGPWALGRAAALVAALACALAPPAAAAFRERASAARQDPASG